MQDLYTDIFVHLLAYGAPILWLVSEDEALCGEFFDLFQMKEKALHFSYIVVRVTLHECGHSSHITLI